MSASLCSAWPTPSARCGRDQSSCCPFLAIRLRDRPSVVDKSRTQNMFSLYGKLFLAKNRRNITPYRLTPFAGWLPVPRQRSAAVLPRAKPPDGPHPRQGVSETTRFRHQETMAVGAGPAIRRWRGGRNLPRRLEPASTFIKIQMYTYKNMRKNIREFDNFVFKTEISVPLLYKSGTKCENECLLEMLINQI